MRYLSLNLTTSYTFILPALAIGALVSSTNLLYSVFSIHDNPGYPGTEFPIDPHRMEPRRRRGELQQPIME